MVGFGTDAACPSFCQCDDVTKKTRCNSVNSSSLLDEVAENVDSNTEDLYFRGNGMTTFDSQFHLKYLTTLDLTGNLLKSVPPGLSKMFPSLRVLLLDDNLIESLSAGELADLKSVTKISFIRNKLTKIGDGTFVDMQKLSQLTLSNNEISSLSSGSFKGLVSMVNFDLEKNKISVLPSGIFDNFKSDNIHIILSWNLLTEIPNGLFDKLPKFEIFDASHNQVEKLGDKAFNGITTQLIGLYNNSISKLNPGSFFNSSIETLALDLNPLICDCDLRKLAGYVKTAHAQCSNLPLTRLGKSEDIASQLCHQCQLNDTCLNGGVCIPIGKTSLNCSCVDDFTGRFCQNDPVCRSVSCHHHGVCVPVGEFDYACRCTDNYSGKNCHVFLDKDEGLTSGETAGIIVGVLFLAFVVVSVLVFGKKSFSAVLLRWRKKKSQEEKKTLTDREMDQI